MLRKYFQWNIIRTCHQKRVKIRGEALSRSVNLHHRHRKWPFQAAAVAAAPSHQNTDELTFDSSVRIASRSCLQTAGTGGCPATAAAGRGTGETVPADGQSWPHCSHTGTCRYNGQLHCHRHHCLPLHLHPLHRWRRCRSYPWRCSSTGGCCRLGWSKQSYFLLTTEYYLQANYFNS